MQIPEDIRNICITYAKNGQYDELLEYLKTCDFFLIRYVKNNNYLHFEENCFGKIWLSSAEIFNDPFDSCWLMPKDITNLIKTEWNWDILNDPVYKKTIRSGMKDFQKSVYIACFSEYPNIKNPKMWHVYANNYQGACIIYKISDLAEALFYNYGFNDWLASKRITPLNPPLDLAPVSYSETQGNIDLSGSPESRYNCIYTKSKYWKDELEWRLSTHSYDKKKGYAVYCKPYGVCFGPDFDENQIPGLLEKLVKKDIKIFRAEFNYATLSMDIKPSDVVPEV